MPGNPGLAGNVDPDGGWHVPQQAVHVVSGSMAFDHLVRDQRRMAGGDSWTRYFARIAASAEVSTILAVKPARFMWLTHPRSSRRSGH
jgi:hypothetical protein